MECCREKWAGLVGVLRVTRVLKVLGSWGSARIMDHLRVQGVAALEHCAMEMGAAPAQLLKAPAERVVGIMRCLYVDILGP